MTIQKHELNGKAMDHSGGMLVMFLLLYFLPWLAAGARRHRNTSAIATLNLLLGWTVLGWIVALVWASTDNIKPRQGRERMGNVRDRIEPTI